MSFYKNFLCASVLATTAVSGNAQTSLVSDLLTVSTPLVNTILTPITENLLGSTLVDQGLTQVLNSASPITDGVLVLGIGFADPLLEAVSVLDETLPGL